MASSNKRNQRAKLKRKKANLERAKNRTNRVRTAKVKYIRDSAGTLIMITQHPNGQLVERAPDHMQ